MITFSSVSQNSPEGTTLLPYNSAADSLCFMRVYKRTHTLRLIPVYQVGRKTGAHPPFTNALPKSRAQRFFLFRAFW